jgi:hypothetical protein
VADSAPYSRRFGGTLALAALVFFAATVMCGLAAGAYAYWNAAAEFRMVKAIEAMAQIAGIGTVIGLSGFLLGCLFVPRALWLKLRFRTALAAVPAAAGLVWFYSVVRSLAGFARGAPIGVVIVTVLVLGPAVYAYLTALTVWTAAGLQSHLHLAHRRVVYIVALVSLAALGMGFCWAILAAPF